jgi:hypothetical protein
MTETLTFQLALYNKEIASLLRPSPTDPVEPKMAEALRFYSSHTAQIEVVRHDRTLEQVQSRKLFNELSD